MPLGWFCGGYAEPCGLSEAQMNEKIMYVLAHILREIRRQPESRNIAKLISVDIRTTKLLLWTALMKGHGICITVIKIDGRKENLPALNG